MKELTTEITRLIQCSDWFNIKSENENLFQVMDAVLEKMISHKNSSSLVKAVMSDFMNHPEHYPENIEETMQQAADKKIPFMPSFYLISSAVYSNAQIDNPQFMELKKEFTEFLSEIVDQMESIRNKVNKIISE